jgi:hypothetical protein
MHSAASANVFVRGAGALKLLVLICSFAALQDFLEASLSEIPAMLKTSGTSNGSTAAAPAAPTALPSYAVIADGRPASSWKVIPGMGHDSCLMCTLMGQLANEPGAAGPVRIGRQML